MERKIGEGAASVVYTSARDPEKEVVKVAKSGFEHLLRKEASVLRGLSHPNIVRMVGFDEARCRLYLPYYHGGDLFWHIIKIGPMSEAVIAPLYRQMLRAVGHLHASGLCHRDLKPENFLLRGDVVVLTDFGLADRFVPEGFRTSPGSPLYMAPELIHAEEVPYDGRLADIYSLGAILYVMASSENLYRTSTSNIVPGDCKYQRLVDEILNEPVKPLPPYLGSVGINKTLDRMLRKDPKQRPRSCEEVLEAEWLLPASMRSFRDVLNILSRTFSSSVDVLPATASVPPAVAAASPVSSITSPGLTAVVPRGGSEPPRSGTTVVVSGVKHRERLRVYGVQKPRLKRRIAARACDRVVVSIQSVS